MYYMLPIENSNASVNEIIREMIKSIKFGHYQSQYVRTLVIFVLMPRTGPTNVLVGNLVDFEAVYSEIVSK